MSEWSTKIVDNYRASIIDLDAPPLEVVSNLVAAVAESVRNTRKDGIQDTMARPPPKDHIWPNYKCGTSSSALTNTCNNIQAMGKAWTTPGSPLYRDPRVLEDTLLGLGWVLDNHYHANVTNMYDNWWDWEIGIPQALLNVFAMIWDKIPDAVRVKGLAAITRFAPDPRTRLSGHVMTGGNLTDKIQVLLLSSALADDDGRLEITLPLLEDVVRVRTRPNTGGSNDGFYTDGTFIQHDVVAYNGSYGAVVMSGMACIVMLLAGTGVLDIGPPASFVEQACHIAEVAMIPVMHNGCVLDSVIGRSVARKGDMGRWWGRIIVGAIAIIANSSKDPETRARLAQFVHTSVTADGSFSDYWRGSDKVIYVQAAAKLMDDFPDVARPVNRPIFHGLSVGQRYVHKTRQYTASLALFSPIVTAFSTGNGENVLGFHHGTGCLMICDQDTFQTGDGFYATIPATMLPGTTTDGKLGSVVPWKAYPNPCMYAGGVSDGAFGTAGMEFSYKQLTGSALAGLKSWFFFDGVVVAMGSRITGPTPAVTVAGVKRVGKASDSYTLTTGFEGGWAHIRGGVGKRTDIGYVCLDGGVFETESKMCSGSWSDIGPHPEDSEVIAERYVTVKIQHGTPTGASYAYAVLPGVGAAGSRSYAIANPIRTFSTDTMHAAVHCSQGRQMAHFFEPGTFGGYTANTPMAVMWDLHTGKMVVSDPTAQQPFVSISARRGLLSRFELPPGAELAVVGEIATMTLDTSDQNMGSTILRVKREY